MDENYKENNTEREEEQEEEEAEEENECFSDSDIELDPSRLGTKEYWEEVFQRDLKVYNETKDIGEICVLRFGNDSMERVVNWMSKSALVNKDMSILDVGCGNGMMLVKLAKNGYRNLSGVDYVESAIQLSRSAAETEGLTITYEVSNVLDNCSLDGVSDSCMKRQYDICHDKGTYDAISLSPRDAKAQRSKYLDSVRRLCRSNSLYIITSCNWTQEELMEHFGQDFVLVERIPSPTFQFGGKTGSRETVLVFRRS